MNSDLLGGKTCFLEGTWTGKGEVLGKGVEYLETSTFTTIKTSPAIVVKWDQGTMHAEKKVGLHAENGFLKIKPALNENGSFKGELLLSHPFGMNEFYTDVQFSFEDGTLVCLANSPGAFQRGTEQKGQITTSVKREYKLVGGELHYDMYLGINGEDRKHHLHAELKLKS